LRDSNIRLEIQGIVTGKFSSTLAIKVLYCRPIRLTTVETTDDRS
jgi:hypothetical protein